MREVANINFEKLRTLIKHVSINIRRYEKQLKPGFHYRHKHKQNNKG